MSTRVHLDHEHWINLVDLYNAGRVCRVFLGCRGGFYGILSKVFFLLTFFFLLITSLVLTVQHCWGDSPVMGSGATWAGSSGLDVTAIQPQLLYKRPGGEGEILLQPGRSVPCSLSGLL